MIATLALETEAAPAPMRRPTHVAVLHEWHAAALRGLGPVNDGTPRCGWYKRRLVRGGVFVPARIWMAQDICPETGELLSDEVLRCEVNGFSADPEEAWTWISSHPVTEQEFRYLTGEIPNDVEQEDEDHTADPSAADAWQLGHEARSAGKALRAVPPEWRTPEFQSFADAWADGWRARDEEMAGEKK